ncbi:MAG TPA: VOC family protein [Dehalococcoidia bacterium]|nr:VOC family protein [Dehalococcoidia bacterium]
MAARPVPEGYHSVTPYLIVDGAARFIEFVKEAFGAEEVLRMPGPQDRVMHAEVRVGDSILMLSDASERYPPTPVMLYLYVEDADAVYRQALQAGASSLAEPQDQLYGDRAGAVEDPVGNRWWIATHIEDVSPEELARRMSAAQQ